MTPEQEKVLVHHEEDEGDKKFQKSLRKLAKCATCGQPLPESGAGSDG